MGHIPEQMMNELYSAFVAIDNAADAAYNWICSELEEDDCMLPSQTAAEHIPLKEGEMVRMIMVRIKLLPDSE